jgi:hypothetical protein
MAPVSHHLFPCPASLRPGDSGGIETGDHVSQTWYYYRSIRQLQGMEEVEASFNYADAWYPLTSTFSRINYKISQNAITEWNESNDT